MPDLEAIVQRMIDAGEPEENIALVIREFKSTQPAPKPAGELDAHGNRIVRNPDGSVKFMQGPGYRGDLRDRPDSNIATIGGFGIAPEDALMAPSLAQGVGALAAGAGRMVQGAASSKIIGKIAPQIVKHAGTVVGASMGGPVGAVVGAGVGEELAAKLAARLAGKAVPAAAEAVSEAAPAVAKATAYQPNVALKAAKDAFEAIGEAPLKAEASNAMSLIQRGKTPEEAIQIVMRNRPAPTVEKMAQTVNKMPGNVKLTAEEVKVGLGLLANGKTPQEALDAVLAQRAFSKIPGVQSNATVASRVAERNNTGRWP